MPSSAAVLPDVADLTAVLEWPTELIDTSAGTIEYAVRGEGPTLVCVHGSPGGADQGLLAADAFRRAGFRILAPSRPGYLRTPITSGRTVDEQADALAALLDALEIDQAHVVGVSGGGAAAYRLAARHGERVSALIAIDAVCMRDDLHVTKLQEALYMSRVGLWLNGFILRHFPKTAAKQFLATESTISPGELAQHAERIVADPYKLEWLRVLMATTGSKHGLHRGEGLENDLVQLAACQQLDLSAITTPTLIVHGENDKDVTIEHPQRALEQIRGAESYWIAGADHTGFFTSEGAEEAQSFAVNWLRCHADNG